jgi:hypothetical protein
MPKAAPIPARADDEITSSSAALDADIETGLAELVEHAWV